VLLGRTRLGPNSVFENGGLGRRPEESEEHLTSQAAALHSVNYLTLIGSLCRGVHLAHAHRDGEGGAHARKARNPCNRPRKVRGLFGLLASG
jgi:hypothetical protein